MRPHSERFPEALLSLLHAPEPVHFNSPAVSCDCLAHVYGNAADHPHRERRYPSDMTDAEWAAIRPLLPVPAWLQGRGGQPEGYCHRQMLDAIRNLVAGGISWRATPADFPAWGRVYAFFRRWREHGLIAEFHDRLRGKVREREGREAEPTAGIIDAQSVRAAATVPASSRGYVGGKKAPGRKRHIVTDCLGLLLVVAVTAANIGDRDAATGLVPAESVIHAAQGLVRRCGRMTVVLLRLAYPTVTNAFAARRLLPMSDRDKDTEILALRHRITVLERQLGPDRVKSAPEDRAFLAALLVPLPRQVLRRLRLLVQPDTVCAGTGT